MRLGRFRESDANTFAFLWTKKCYFAEFEKGMFHTSPGEANSFFASGRPKMRFVGGRESLVLMGSLTMRSHFLLSGQSKMRLRGSK
jgi:hypothetical protein